MKKYFSSLLFFFCIQHCIAQYDKVLALFYQRDMEQAAQLINTEFSDVDQTLLNAKYALENKDLATSFQLLLEVDTLSISTYQKAFHHYFLAQTFDSNTEMDEAIGYYYKAQALFDKEKLRSYYNQVNLDLYYLYIASETESLAKNAPKFLDEFSQLANELNHPQQRVQANIDLAFERLEQEDLESFNRLFEEGFSIARQNKDAIAMAKLHSYKGLVYGEILEDFEIAKFHYDKAIQLYDSIQNSYKLKPLYMNKANIYAKQNNYPQAISYLLQADQQATADVDEEISMEIYNRLADAYEKLGKIDSALYYTQKSIVQMKTINEKQQFINLTRFEAEKKENENIVLQEKNNRKFYLLLILGIVLVAILLLTYLVYSNAKRKQLLLSKKKELAEQKNQRLIKEQELKTIDAMLEGQEKERQRLASDLHDNIGASLTSVKLHFNQIKHQFQKKEYDEAVFAKTDALLDETYQEIRNLAHLKNAGVLAKDGLVPALQKLVEKSSTAQLQLALSLHELNNRLSNSLEIGIFRIIQELITNIIKHAKATQVSISITNHDDFINIMVEDNGIGFDSKVTQKSGMGLDSIRKKVAHFNGEMTIDSQPGIGTTVIIDIPL